MKTKYIIAQKHYANEEEIFNIISKDAQTRGINLNKENFRKFLAEDATTVLAKGTGCGTYNPNRGSDFVYMLSPNFETKEVIMIMCGKRKVLGETPWGTKQIMLVDADFIWAKGE